MEDFNWYEDAAEIDVEEFEPVEKDRLQISKFFDMLRKIFNYAILVCGSVYIFRYIFNKYKMTILGVNLNMILQSIVIGCGSFNLVVLLAQIFHQMLKKLGFKVVEKRFKSIYRWLSVTVWFLLCLYFLKYVK